MAKKYDLNPETDTKKSVTDLIDEDLQKESALLQKLIGEVVEANKKVKSSHQEKLSQTQEKLRVLNADIERLKNDINSKDRDTTMKQLDYLLDSRNRIFDALDEMRTKNIESYLEEDDDAGLESLKNRLFSTIEESLKTQKDIPPFMHSFKAAITDFISATMDESRHYFSQDHPNQKQLSTLVDSFNDKAGPFTETFGRLPGQLLESLEDRKHVLQSESTNEGLDERIKSRMDEREKALEEEDKKIESNFKKQYAELESRIRNVFDDNLNALKAKHAKRLESEKENREALQQEIKSLRLDIIKAEKQNDHDKLMGLLKAYEKKEKQSTHLFEEQLKEKVSKKVASKTEKLRKQQKKLEMDYLNKRYENKFKKAALKIHKGDSAELFKLNDDKEGLRHDFEFNRTFTGQLEDKIDQYESFIDTVLIFIRKFQDLLEVRHVHFRETEIEMLEHLTPMKRTFNESQLELTKRIMMKHLKERALKPKLDFAFKEHAFRLRHQIDCARIDKQMTDIQGNGEITKLTEEENLQNDKIYQNALINLADREYELQLLKNQSVYDNEISLTKVQAERLNIGYDVNKTMVSTTLESQINFANQQIEYAQNEYDLRVKNIEQSLKKELEYAEEKLKEHQKKYRTDRLELIKERDRKLEDLAYKQALFTAQKDKKRLSEQEASIRAAYDEKIERINENENNDPNVSRYRDQIDNAKTRAEKARLDAKKIRDKSIQTFNALLENSEEKLSQFTESRSKDSLSPGIEDEASTTAKKRYEESLADAKRLHKEKTEGPKARIEALDKALKDIQEDKDAKEKLDILITQKKQAETRFNKRVEGAEQELKESLKSIEAEKEAFLRTHEEKIKEIGTLVVGTDLEELRFDLKESLKRLKKEHRQRRKEYGRSLKANLEKRKQAIKRLKKTLDQALHPVYKAHKSFLSAASSSQQEKEKQVRKQLDKELKEARNNLSNKYKV